MPPSERRWCADNITVLRPLRGEARPRGKPGRVVNGRYKVSPLISAVAVAWQASLWPTILVILDRDVASKILRFDFFKWSNCRVVFQRKLAATRMIRHRKENMWVSDVCGYKRKRIQWLMHGRIREENESESIYSTPAVTYGKLYCEYREQILSACGRLAAHARRIIHLPWRSRKYFDGSSERKNLKISVLRRLISDPNKFYAGSVHYLSQNRPRHCVSKQSDICALGIVILYEIYRQCSPLMKCCHNRVKHFSGEYRHWDSSRSPASFWNIVMPCYGERARWPYIKPLRKRPIFLTSALSANRNKTDCLGGQQQC